MKNQVMRNLQRTMDNWRCLDKDMVNEVVDEYLETVTIEDDILYCKGQVVRNFDMLVAHIKRKINSMEE